MHHKLLQAELSRKLNCGHKDRSKRCLKLITKPVLRARTPTSAGMKGINDTFDSKRSINASHEADIISGFNLNMAMVQSTNAYFINATNILNIARDNLR